MPCLSSNADRDLKDSIRLSNAESQLALPLRTTTIFGSSVICSPNGSAVCTGAGAAAGGAGVSAATGGVAGVAEGVAAPGVAVGGASGFVDPAGGGDAPGAGAGDCASAMPKPSEIAVIGINASMTRRNERRRFIGYPPGIVSSSDRLGVPVHVGEGPAC